MATTPTGERRAAPKAAGRRWWKRWLVAPVILLACLVIPWLVPWPWQHPDLTSAGSGNPSASVVASPDPSASPTQAEPPTDESVDELGRKLAGEKESFDLPVDRAEVRGVSTKPGPYERLGRIAIPRIGMEQTFGEGVFAETLVRGPGHWPGTPMPGRSGNSVISGHRNTNTQPFKRIDELQPGDKIVVTLDGKPPIAYAVENTTIVPEPKYRAFVLQQPTSDKTRELTIFACHPEGNPIYRIVVRAKAAT